MTTRAQGKRKSAFIANALIPSGSYFDFVINGTNYRILDTDFFAALGVTGTIVQDGDPLGTPVLDTQGTVNNIRNIEVDSDSGIAASVSAQNGLYLKLDAQPAAGSGVAVLDANNNIRHIKAGPNADVTLSGDDIVVDVTATFVGLSESALFNTATLFNRQQSRGAGVLTDGATVICDLATDTVPERSLGRT